MELIEIIFNYHGALIEAAIQPEENYQGMLYPVSLNGVYRFTLCFNDDEGWSVLRENDGVVPDVEERLFKIITSQLKWEINNAA